MSKSRIWQSAATLLFATAVSLSLSVGCAKQGEGERCDSVKAGNSDCDDGLACVKVDGIYDRCCPPEGAAISDSRCQSSVVSTSGGATGAGGSSSGGGLNASGGAAEAGAPAMSGGQSSGAGAEGT